MTREWFMTYCQNAAANVLDKDNKVRFTYEQLSEGLKTCTEHKCNTDIVKLHSKIVNLCDNKYPGTKVLTEEQEWMLVLTLLNIHAAYLMLTGAWREEPLKAEGGTDEYGFEIF